MLLGLVPVEVLRGGELQLASVERAWEMIAAWHQAVGARAGVTGRPWTLARRCPRGFACGFPASRPPEPRG